MQMRKHFGGIVEECKRLKGLGHSPIVHASHSNCKTLCNVPRNLTDEQIKAIVEEFDGTIGVVAYAPFVEGGPDYRRFQNKARLYA